MTTSHLHQRSELASRTSVLVYDADCGFCTKSANWLQQRFQGNNASIASWQSLELAEFGLSETDVQSAAWWIDQDGSNYGAHRAIARAMRACGGPVAVAGVIIEKPPVSWLAAPIYRWIARHRNQMPGGTDSCAL